MHGGDIVQALRDIERRLATSEQVQGNIERRLAASEQAHHNAIDDNRAQLQNLFTDPRTGSAALPEILTQLRRIE